MRLRSKAMTSAALVGLLLAGTAGSALARPFHHYGYRHHGIGPGAVVAGAALGVLGAAAAGVAADHYYNGYPAYAYGPGYGPHYGYDYLPGHGYYGPY